jgi:hypothetical protein
LPISGPSTTLSEGTFAGGADQRPTTRSTGLGRPPPSPPSAAATALTSRGGSIVKNDVNSEVPTCRHRRLRPAAAPHGWLHVHDAWAACDAGRAGWDY